MARQEEESYADIIDAFEKGVGVKEGESLTDYIKRNNIKIQEVKPMDQESGIKSLDEVKMMASDNNNQRLLEQLYEEFIDLGFSPREAEIKARQEFEKRSVKREAPSIKMAEYRPGDYNKDDYDPIIVEEYEKYKYDLNEQKPGAVPMSIDQFLSMVRANVMGGGIMRAQYEGGTKEVYDNPFDARKAADVEDMIKKMKNESDYRKLQQVKGGVAKLLMGD